MFTLQVVMYFREIYTVLAFFKKAFVAYLCAFYVQVLLFAYNQLLPVNLFYNGQIFLID